MNKMILLDGATGTMIQRAGLPLGGRPEIFGMEHPEIITDIHRQYIEAGSGIIYSNTFGANAHKLAGTGFSAAEVVQANVATAKKAAAGRALVALDVGPIGELMEPLGTLSFDEAYHIFLEMFTAGEAAGADLIVMETFTDLAEVRAGVLAAKEHSKLPIWVTMSFERSGRTFTGTSVACMGAVLEGLGVDAMGINCSLGPEEIYPMIVELRKWTDKPILVKPNAGLPDPATGAYGIDGPEFGRQMRAFAELGIHIMGGCCGTTPEHIRALSELDPAEETPRTRLHGVCSAGQMCAFGGVRVIGERINPTGKKRFQQALREHDMNYIMERAIEQADAGADILDINVGLPGIDEVQMMKDVVSAVQSVVTLPLQIDSSNPEAIEAGLRTFCGRAIINSVNGEDETLSAVLPLAKKYGAAVIGLTMDRSGIPQTAEQRYAIAEKIKNAAEAHGIPAEDIIIDCLTLTVSAQQEQAAETLKAVRRVKEELGLHCTLGVSNISFGLPAREQITRSFLTQAMAAGLDLPIINPNTAGVMDAVYCFRALSGEDVSCGAYIERFAGAAAAPTPTAMPAAKKSSVENSGTGMTVTAAVLKGLKEETARLTEAELAEKNEMEVINGVLIPALDAVGEKYEKGEIFLPQLINAANAACAGFELIKQRIAARGGESISKGTIVLATVEGDIHDIGKNIVRVVLENYGYRVLDLGRDVPPAKVVEAAVRNDVKLIGLSALMTTTLGSMKKTIEALRASGHDCKVFVGGAVLTEAYAMEIGADYYTKDAKASADVAKLVLG